MFIPILGHLGPKSTSQCDSNISGTFKPHSSIFYLIMKEIGSIGCGVALLNKLRHSPCLGIIFVIFCNNSCQVLLWQFAHWHTSSSCPMPIKNLPQGRLTFFPTCDSLDVTNDTHIIMTYNNLPMRMLDMCHNLVHKPVRVCTYAHTHSRRVLHMTPIMHISSS